MTLLQLNYVITICDCGSLNKAAQMLYVSQPSLTGALKELEKEIGITIFNRTPRGVTLTADGAEFMQYARQVYLQYEDLLEKFGPAGKPKGKFGVSSQHYSFAVKAFVETVKKFDATKYEFAIRETKTKEVIDDVAVFRSEIGILYMSDFNRTAIKKLLTSAGLDFHPLIKCKPYVYIWKGHPLAKNKSITFEQLLDYPCLSFEQGESGSFYLAEELLSTADYKQVIKANDRATMLNLMVGLNGYTLCSGIICEELNGDDYIAVPFDDPKLSEDMTMEIGYINKKNMLLSKMGRMYIEEIQKYLLSNAK